jgi:hypothetical protein
VPTLPAETPLQTAAQIILDTRRDVLPEITTAIPADGASQHDHGHYPWWEILAKQWIKQTRSLMGPMIRGTEFGLSAHRF